MPLTDSAIRAAKPAAKPAKLRDGGGLYLLLKPDGARWWRLDYRRPVTGTRNTLSLGTYPGTGLKDARERRDAARKLLAAGIDPGEHRKATKKEGRIAAANSFEAVAAEWLALQRPKMASATYDKAVWTFDTLLNPWIGSRPIAEIDAPELLDVLRRIESRGANETAHRTKQRAGQVFRYAIVTGRAKADPTASLRGALASVVVKSRAAITEPAKIGDLLRAIDGYSASLTVRSALKLAALLFARPGELRAMEWAELDFDAGEWRLPAARMKMREEHIVPLAPQAVAILRELQPLTGRGRYVFPSERGASRPMSENTINVALRTLGFDKETMTGHGFRAMASTRLNEMGWPPDVIERQLAHKERDKVRAAYNRAQYMAERHKMMRAWADHLDALRTGANVVAINRRKAG